MNKDGGSVYPTFGRLVDLGASEGGMTLKDHYAGIAFAVLISKEPSTDSEVYMEHVCGEAFRWADAMIECKQKLEKRRAEVAELSRSFFSNPELGEQENGK